MGRPVSFCRNPGLGVAEDGKSNASSNNLFVIHLGYEAIERNTYTQQQLHS